MLEAVRHDEIRRELISSLYLYLHHDSEIGATVINRNRLPQVDFIARASLCLSYAESLRVQKRKRRIVSTLETGTVQIREIRKISSHPVEISEALSRLVPSGQRYGYDLIVWIGMARYLRNLRRKEIRAELLHEKTLFFQTAPDLRVAAEKGYPLHIDATNE